MKKNIVFAFCFAFIYYSFSQEEAVSNVRVGNVYLSAGSHTGNDELEVGDLFKLASNSEILKDDISQYDKNSFLRTGDGRYVSMKLGLDFADKNGKAYKMNPQLQLGFTYMKSNTWNFNLRDEKRVRFDTLTSSSSSHIIFVDSIYDSKTYLDYSSENLLLDIALIYRTDPLDKWSVFGGIGLAGGVSVRAATDVHRINTSHIRYVIPGGNYYYYGEYNTDPQHDRETFKNEMNILAIAQLPVGVNFRVSKSDNFWKNVNLFYEMTPFLKYLNVPETGSYISVGMKHGVGLKMNVGKS